MEKKEYITIVSSILMTLPSLFKKILPLSLVSQKTNLKGPHFHLMGILFSGRSLTISQIVDELNIARPNMSPLINKLLKLGYIEKHSDKNDRRSNFIKLSKKGIDFLNQQRSDMAETLMKKTKDLTTGDFKKLAKALDDLNSVLEKIN